MQDIIQNHTQLRQSKKEYQIFETERLLIKPTNIEDASLILELVNTPKWIDFIGQRNVHTLADAKNYILEKMLPQLGELGYGNNTIIRKKDGIKLGSCGLYNREGIDGVDIGFAFLPQYENKGYAFESAKKVLGVAKKEYQLTKINAITTKNNRSSQKLLKKLGFAFVKTIRIPNDTEELLLFILIF